MTGVVDPIRDALANYSPPPAKCRFGRPHRWGATYISGVHACASCDAVYDGRVMAEPSTGTGER